MIGRREPGKMGTVVVREGRRREGLVRDVKWDEGVRFEVFKRIVGILRSV